MSESRIWVSSPSMLRKLDVSYWSQQQIKVHVLALLQQKFLENCTKVTQGWRAWNQTILLSVASLYITWICPIFLCLTIASSLGPALKLAKVQITLTYVLCQLSLFGVIESHSFFQLTTFLTCDSSRLVPKQVDNGNEASRLVVNFE